MFCPVCGYGVGFVPTDPDSYMTIVETLSGQCRSCECVMVVQRIPTMNQVTNIQILAYPIKPYDTSGAEMRREEGRIGLRSPTAGIDPSKP